LHCGLNQGDGISILSDTAARDNTCDSNGLAGNGAGIHAKGTENRIDGNNVSNNDRGIDVDDVRNFVIRNSARDNAGMNYVIVAGNRVGAIVVPPLSGDIAGDTDSDAAGVGTTDPWANFTY
jgi:parallel beta-helix repeat protein